MKFLAPFLAVFMLHANARAQLTVRVQFAPLSNFLYQLDCVSGTVEACSKKTYTKLWERIFPDRSETKNEIQIWSKLTSRYKKELRLGAEAEDTIGPPDFHLGDKLRTAGFQAKGIDDYLERLDLVIDPSDRAAFEGVIKTLYPSFEIWWRKEAFKRGTEFARGTEKLLSSREVKSRISDFSKFYESRLPQGYTLLFNLFYLPAGEKESTHGQQIDNYSIAEFLSSEKPTNRIDVVLHELCHFFYGTGQAGRESEFRARFLKLQKTTAIPALNLLNEGLATAFGNGMINRQVMKSGVWREYLAREKSFYDDPNIDLAAKTVLPMLDRWLEEGKTIFDEDFAKRYVSLLEKSFGPRLASPKIVLKEMILVGDGRYGAPFRKIIGPIFRPSSMYSSEGEMDDPRTLGTYKRDQDTSALLIIHPDDLAKIEKLLSVEEIKRIRVAYAQKKSVLYAFRRSPTALSFLVVAEDYDHAVKLVENLADVKSGFSGIFEDQK